MLKKIISNTLAQVFSKFWTAIISIILIWLLTNYFTVELFWSYNKVYNYIYIFAFLVDLWLYAITIKEISANKDKAEYIFWNILTLRVITGSFVIVFATTISFFLPWYNSELIMYSILIASFFALFSLINSSMLALMQSYMKMEFSLFSAIIWKLVILLLTFLLFTKIYPNPEISWYFEPFLFVMSIWAFWILINAILNYFYAKKIINIRFNFDWKYIKKIFITSLPYWIALFLAVVYTKIDIVLISLIEKWLIAERSIALYSLPLKIMDVFMMIWAFLMNSLLPSMSKYYKENNFKKLKEITQNTFKLLLVFWVWIISLGLVFKDYIIRLIANENYLIITELNRYTASNAFDIVFFMLLFFYLGLVFSYLLVATEKQNRLLKISIILTIVNIIWNIIIIPYYSFIWAWIVTVLTQILFLSLAYFFSRDVIKFQIPIFYILLIIISWFILNKITNLLITNYPLSDYYNLLYWFALFGIYSWIFWFFEYKKIKT